MASGIDGAGPDTRSNTTDAGADAPTAAMDEAQISSTRDWAGHAECGRLLGWGGWRKTLKGGGKPRAGLAHDALGPNPALGQSTAFCCSERAVVVQGEAHASANRSPDCGTYSASDTMAQRCADAHADGHTDTSYMGPFVFTNTVANTGADTSHGNAYTGTDCSADAGANSANACANSLTYAYGLGGWPDGGGFPELNQRIERSWQMQRWR